MKELKYTENTLEHTWETVTENPVQEVCNPKGLRTTGDSDSSGKGRDPVAKGGCSELSHESRQFPYSVSCQSLSNNKAHKKGQSHRERKGP